ncbi:6-hydroxy-3-succinoylpyridine 3-monooxygenase HspA [subsurface metagenome]
MCKSVKQTNLYVDGFNLYYSAVRGTQYKWLNIATLCQILLPHINIHRIKYFSARVKASKHDPDAPTRQDFYLRACETIPNLEVIEGHFVRWPRLMPQYPLAYPNYPRFDEPPIRVQVQRTEEKGSDVNLATHLLYDCFTKDFDEAVVISNDSDLALPIEIVRTKLQRNVVIINPHRTEMVKKYKNCRISQDLKRVATYCIHSINTKVLASSQFPSTLTDSKGSFSKPATW